MGDPLLIRDERGAEFGPETISFHALEAIPVRYTIGVMHFDGWSGFGPLPPETAEPTIHVHVDGELVLAVSAPPIAIGNFWEVAHIELLETGEIVVSELGTLLETDADGDGVRGDYFSGGDCDDSDATVITDRED